MASTFIHFENVPIHTRMEERLEKEGKLMLKIYNCIHDIIILIHPAFSGT